MYGGEQLGRCLSFLDSGATEEEVSCNIHALTEFMNDK
jgi:hypothetical protein